MPICTSAGKVEGGVSGDSSKPNPVAVVFGWIGSSRRNVKKYEEIYHSLGIDTITISGDEVKVGGGVDGGGGGWWEVVVVNRPIVT